MVFRCWVASVFACVMQEIYSRPESAMRSQTTQSDYGSCLLSSSQNAGTPHKGWFPLVPLEKPPTNEIPTKQTHLQVTPEQIKKAMESQMAEDDQKIYEAP